MHRNSALPPRVLVPVTALLGTLACTPLTPVPGPAPPPEVTVEAAEPETAHTFDAGAPVPVELTAVRPEDGATAEPLRSGDEAEVSFSHLEQSAECTVVLPEGTADLGSGHTLTAALECGTDVEATVLDPALAVLADGAPAARGRVVLSDA
ncbi:hypothetical protein IDM40_26730 [Nocardiopsis sp. HNM0947]|uniref:Lipoprotein n=1 Tax=Nocardiopsis coralli TaxID=2772213 RepID=A0ABR9PEL7_9ACTN|nr:hypothetical protein [Nocardiopsis coralli]MBE3002268.1 hypothetical protein [Nocardiopsis coralli]